MVKRENLEARLDAAIARTISGDTPGMVLLVSEGDEVLIRKGYGLSDLETKRPMDPADNFIIASNTKQFTCIAILMLMERGLLKLDEPIERFFPDYPDYRKTVTVRQLMTHVNGIPEYFNDDVMGADIYGLKDTTEEMVARIKGFGDLYFPPQTKFSYCNSAYVMLGDIVRQLTGIPFGKFIEENILKPAGMKNSLAPDYMDNRPASLIKGYIKNADGSFTEQPYDMTQVGYADGNIQSNVDDLFAWHKYLYMSQDESILKRSTLATVWEENKLADGSPTGYGFGFFLGQHRNHREIWHTGGSTGFITRLSRYPDDGVTVAMLTNLEGLPKNELYFSFIDEILD